MNIESKLSAFLKSPAGKAKVADTKRDAAKVGRPFGQPTGMIVSRQAATQAGYAMRDILYGHLVLAGLDSISKDEIYVSEPRQSNGGGYEVAVWFEPDAVKRRSLDPYRFPEGVDNIVMLFSHGWDTNGGRVSGIWHGQYTHNKTLSKSNPFMQEAVNDFNAEHDGYAELDERYT